MCVDSAAPLVARRLLRVLLVESNPNTADTIAEDFRRNGVEITAVGTLAEARAVLLGRPTNLDVVILEIRLPDGRGESLLPDIEACPRQPGAVITSAHLSELGAEALDYRPVTVPKPIDTAALLRIVKTVAAGYTRQMIRRFTRRYDLSKREAETVALLVQGHGTKKTARLMDCSEKTVYFHLAHVCQKVKCRDYHELVGRLLAFTCQALGHTPPEYAAFTERTCP